MFKVSARTLLHLGSELISSDAVAFYELIKNAFDAKSERVKIEVVSRIDFDELESLRALIEEARADIETLDEDEYTELLASLTSQIKIDEAAFEAEELRESIDGASSLDELEQVLDEANYIVISDTGEGMSRQDLQDIYLTIGTPVRHLQREERAAQEGNSNERPILGEKGIGRLSVMRLGWKLHIETTKAGEAYWNELDIDWREFDNFDKMIEQIEVAPSRGSKKKERELKGTVIRVSALAAPWTAKKLEEIARTELSKFTDPFATRPHFQISVRYNGEVQVIPRMQDLLFKHAHMKVVGDFVVTDNDYWFEGEIRFTHGRVDKLMPLYRAMEQLTALTKSSEKRLRSLGPFHIVLYWFNRRLMTKIDGIGDVHQVRELQRQWSGIMLFRNGFRIHPYGNEDDDWLGFDRLAFSRGGYKLNKTQFIGKIEITREQNPGLVDQTNREGLKDTPEKAALVDTVHHLVQTDIWRLITGWEKDAKKAEPAKVIQSKIERVQKLTASLIKEVEKSSEHASAAEKKSKREAIDQVHEQVHAALTQAAQFVEEAENERAIIMHLAGIGLMLEVVAHDLQHATNAALATLEKLKKAEKKNALDSAKLRALLDTLHAQLKTLDKRLRVLDPHSTAGRQRKEKFDLITWTRAIVDAHAPQLEDAKIIVEIEVIGPTKENWEVEMVKGVFIQILENLVNNSIYWLAHQASMQKGFRPILRIELDPGVRTLKIIDNGPGVPVEQADDVFEPFFTTKPPGESRGLGLYIARENARYSGLTISLSDHPIKHKNRLNAFVITWPAEEKETRP